MKGAHTDRERYVNGSNAWVRPLPGTGAAACFVLLLTALLKPTLAVSQDAAAEPGSAAATEVVETLHATLLDAMQRAGELGFGGRYALLEPVLAKRFDFATIGRIVTGRYWGEADEARREAFLEAFAALSAATYATNFSGYAGERFETRGSEKSRGSLIVRTVLVKPDGEEIPLNYMLRESDNGWKIVNVVAQGVSDLSLKRADYTAVIKSEGFDALVSRLREKTDEMRRAR